MQPFSTKIKKELLKGVEDPINEYIQISGINFKIVGVYSDGAGDREENRVWIPLSTSQAVFNGGERISNMLFSLKPEVNFAKTLTAAKMAESEILQYLKQAHIVAPDDLSAIRVNNVLVDVKRFKNLTDSIAYFFWFVGICTIIAGVVGVSNIMLIVVKERTKEIGIRRSIGATPGSIVSQIILESLTLTILSGSIGFMIGVGLVEYLGGMIDHDAFSKPQIDFGVATSAMIILVISGVLAGLIPASRAIKIRPVDAIRTE